MSLTECIRENFGDGLVRRCADSGCRLGLKGLESFLVLKGERLCEHERISDCIIFADNVLIGIVELKSKTAHANQIIDKLTNAASLTLAILRKCGTRSSDFEILFIVLCKAWRVSDHRIISNRRIRLKGRNFGIVTKKCGTNLATLTKFAQSIP